MKELIVVALYVIWFHKYLFFWSSVKHVGCELTFQSSNAQIEKFKLKYAKKAKMQINMGETPSKKCIFFIKGCGPGVSDTSAYICQDSVRIAAIYQKYRNPILANVTAAKTKMRHFSILRNNTSVKTFVSFHQFPKKLMTNVI